MLGRGVKRKWSSLEDLESEELPGAPVTEERTQDGSEDGTGQPPGGSRLQQRQLVLVLCLEKLQHYQAGVELGLRRSVLLINTLRRIQEEMWRDGSDVRRHAADPDARLLRDDFREDELVTCPGCVEGNEEDLSPSVPPSQEPGSSDAGNAMGYLGDLALDDIFEDIDTSMYETSDLPSARGAGASWPFWPDEDMKPRPSAGSLQSCLLDLNELDHIMDILVKS